MRTTPIAVILLWATVFVVADSRSQILAGDEPSMLGKILTDEKLWGQDAFAAFGSLESWKQLGVSSVLVFPDRIVSGTPSATPEEAGESVARMVEAMGRARLALQPSFAGKYAAAIRIRVPKLRTEFSRFLEDDSYRIVWKAPEAEFLKKDMKMQSVIDAYGDPEKTSTEIVHSQGERRPAILTHYHYAAGAVQFVESDLAPIPGFVDRVVVDVAAATKEILGP